MNFYIKTLKLWFLTHRQPKEYHFEPDKVNVITGNSSTGKSSILQIIDYCMLSKSSKIVEDVINENVSWYGLVFHLNGSDYAIARKSPKNGAARYEFYWQENCSELPYDTPVASKEMKRGDIEARLDAIVGITDKMLIGDKNQIQLHFRHLLPLSYLSEDIIAAMNSYFDFGYLDEIMDMEDFKFVVRTVIGTYDKNIQRLKQEFMSLDKQIANEEKWKTKDEKKQDKYQRHLKDIIGKAQQMGLVQGSEETIDAMQLIDCVKKEIDYFRSLRRSHKKLDTIGELYQKRNEIKSQLAEYKRLQQQYNRAVKYAEDVKDSMMPMDFLLNNLNSQILTEETAILYKALESTFVELKEMNLVTDTLPDGFEESRKALMKQLEAVETEISKLSELSMKSVNPDALMRYFSLEQDLKGLSKPQAKYVGDVALSNMRDKRNELNNEILELNNKIEKCGKDLDNEIQYYYDDQDGMSSSYSNCKVHFNYDRLNVELRRENEIFSIKNVGSKSNYMFMHLCFFLGLHQYLLYKSNNYVPSFLIVDQPSIPYYSGQNIRDGEILTNKEDKTRLKSAFRLMESFMKQNIDKNQNRHFQIIMFEHADPYYWEGEFSHFMTNYVFVEDKDYALIPDYVDIPRNSFGN